jgi:hypothetical protein
MSSVWDDPELNDAEEVTPLPEVSPAVPPLELSAEQLERVAEQVIERVVREIVPDMAERIIREEIARLTEAK